MLDGKIDFIQVYRISQGMPTGRSMGCYLESNLRYLANNTMFWKSQPSESWIEVFLIAVWCQWSSVFDLAMEWTQHALDSGIDRVESRDHWRTLEFGRRSPAVLVHSMSIVWKSPYHCAFHNCTRQSHRPVELCWCSIPRATSWIHFGQSVDRRSKSKCHLACYHCSAMRDHPCAPLRSSPRHRWALENERFNFYQSIVSVNSPVQTDQATAVLLESLEIAHWGRAASLFGPWTVHVLYVT